MYRLFVFIFVLFVSRDSSLCSSLPPRPVCGRNSQNVSQIYSHSLAGWNNTMILGLINHNKLNVSLCKMTSSYTFDRYLYSLEIEHCSSKRPGQLDHSHYRVLSSLRLLYPPVHIPSNFKRLILSSNECVNLRERCQCWLRATSDSSAVDQLEIFSVLIYTNKMWRCFKLWNITRGNVLSGDFDDVYDNCFYFL